MNQGQIFDQRAAHGFHKLSTSFKLQATQALSLWYNLWVHPTTVQLAPLQTHRNKFWSQPILIWSATITAPSSPKSFRASTNKLTQTHSDFISTSIAPDQLKSISISAQVNVKIWSTSKCKRSEAKLFLIPLDPNLFQRARAPLRVLRFELWSFSNN